MRRASGGLASANRRSNGSSPRLAHCRRYASAARQNPPGVGSPARASAARFAAFGPTHSGLVAEAALSGMMKSVMSKAPILPSPRVAGRGKKQAARSSLHMIPVTGQRIDHGDLFHREVG